MWGYIFVLDGYLKAARSIVAKGQSVAIRSAHDLQKLVLTADSACTGRFPRRAQVVNEVLSNGSGPQKPGKSKATIEMRLHMFD